MRFSADAKIRHESIRGNRTVVTVEVVTSTKPSYILLTAREKIV